MKILISGYTGFVGINLLEYLILNGFQAEGLNLRTWDNRVESDVEVIIHLAGKAHDLKKVAKPEDYYVVNTDLTQKLFSSFLISNATKFIFLSSVKACADEVDSILTEEAIPNPKTVYGQSKLAAEKGIIKMLEDLKQTNQDKLNHSSKIIETANEKKVYILRPCMIHGKGNKGNLNLLYQIVAKNIPWPLGAYQNKRSFCSIDNLLFIIKELVKRNDITPGVYNVADSEPLSTNEVIGLMAQVKSKEPLVLNLPKYLINGLAKFGDLFKLPLNTERLQKLTESYLVSNNKIVTAIGGELPVSSREGLLKTIKSFSKNAK
jgi:nucleoside-diphosphate-sugar epimerase